MSMIEQSTIELAHAGGTCTIECRAGLLNDRDAFADAIADAIAGEVLIVTDRNVAAHYLDRVERALAAHRPGTLVLPPGEPAKTLANWQQVLDALVERGAQRDATVVALGGGVIGDLAGFAAASYMRGIRVVQVPTTLLAQVDASIGGKTGVNLPAGKNLVGAFHQPARVLIDPTTLATLDDREFRAGLAEVVKYGAIRDVAFLDALEADAPALLDRQAEPLTAAILRAARHKVEVVAADEREAGQRALLNFGHTFGHALEAETGYTRFLHGEAVAIGMAQAAMLGARLGELAETEADRLVALLERLGLPTRRPDDVDPDALAARMRLDKKNRDGRVRLVLLDALGRARVRDDVAPERILEVLHA